MPRTFPEQVPLCSQPSAAGQWFMISPAPSGAAPYLQTVYDGREMRVSNSPDLLLPFQSEENLKAKAVPREPHSGLNPF